MLVFIGFSKYQPEPKDWRRNPAPGRGHYREMLVGTSARVKRSLAVGRGGNVFQQPELRANGEHHRSRNRL